MGRGRSPGADKRFADNFGLRRKSILRLGGIERLAAMTPEARWLLIKLAMQHQKKMTLPVDNTVTNGDI